VRQVNGGIEIQVTDDPPIGFHKPSVDHLFLAAAKLKHLPDTVGILLTGMGKDGAKGLLALRNSGAHTITQDEATSVVFGMPRVAAEIGASKEVAPLDEIAQRIFAAFQANFASASRQKKAVDT
jgi:two-component system, chemotaxis family, protein-glutamate methylesterase/glutaminase